MKNIILIIMLLFFSQVYSYSQTFHLGLGMEFYAYRFENGSSTNNSLSPLPSFNMVVSKDISELVSINLMPGILFRPESYDGFELGLFVKNKLSESRISFSEGLNVHFAQESAHGTSLVQVTDSKIIYFVFLGAAYSLSDIVLLRISVHQALNGEFGYNYDVYNVMTGPKKIITMLRIGIEAML